MKILKKKVKPEHPVREKPEISAENFIFLAAFLGFFAVFMSQMGVMNALNTMMNTAYSLLIDTVLYLTAICVLMGAVSALFSEFGVVSLANRLLNPLMVPLYNLPGAASLGVVTTFLSDNPAILSLAEDQYFKGFFKKYQFPALTNLGTAFGMGLIVCTYMLSLSLNSGESYGLSVAVGLLGAVVGSIVSTRLMLRFTAKLYGKEEEMVPHAPSERSAKPMRPVRVGRHRLPVHVRAAGGRLLRRQDGRQHRPRRADHLHPGHDADQRPQRRWQLHRRGL